MENTAWSRIIEDFLNINSIQGTIRITCSLPSTDILRPVQIHTSYSVYLNVHSRCSLFWSTSIPRAASKFLTLKYAALIAAAILNEPYVLGVLTNLMYVSPAWLHYPHTYHVKDLHRVQNVSSATVYSCRGNEKLTCRSSSFVNRKVNWNMGYYDSIMWERCYSWHFTIYAALKFDTSASESRLHGVSL